MEAPAPTVEKNPPPSDEPGPPPRPARARWLVVLAAATLALGPILGGVVTHERTQWRIAAGLEHWLDQDLPAALASLDAAAKIAPDEPRIYELRAKWRIDAGNYEGALADARRLHELSKKNPQSYRLQSEALIFLGRPKEALKITLEYGELEKSLLQEIQATTLNEIAYHRALANSGVTKGLEEIERAIELLNADAALIDTRGFLEYRNQNYDAALEDLDAAVAEVERELQTARAEEKIAVGWSVQDPRRIAWEMKTFERVVAVIRYHRGLVFAALNRPDDAEKDYRRVRELGFEPNPQLF